MLDIRTYPSGGSVVLEASVRPACCEDVRRCTKALDCGDGTVDGRRKVTRQRHDVAALRVPPNMGLAVRSGSSEDEGRTRRVRPRGARWDCRSRLEAKEMPRGVSERIVDHRQGCWRATCTGPRIGYDLHPLCPQGRHDLSLPT